MNWLPQMERFCKARWLVVTAPFAAFGGGFTVRFQPAKPRMVNWGAVRRARRRATATDGPGAIGVGQASSAMLQNVEIVGCGKGLVSNGHVTSDGLTIRNTGVAVENHGFLDATNTLLEDNSVGIDNHGRFRGRKTIIRNRRAA
jgi:hypothetical protein